MRCTRGFPTVAFGISEYGAGASIYQHEIDPAQPKTDSFWHPEEWQGIAHEAAYTRDETAAVSLGHVRLEHVRFRLRRAVTKAITSAATTRA